VGFFQFAPRLGDKAWNWAKVDRALAGVQADLMVLPELFNTGYGFNSREEVAAAAETLDVGPTATRILDLSRRTGMAIVAGLAERGNGRLYNSCLIATPEGERFVYRKIHLFNREKLYFDRGDNRPAVRTVKGVRIGTVVCFDYFFPELSRSLAILGAQIICHPANLVLQYAQSMTITRAVENRVFWILCNRIGAEEQQGQTLTFTGASQIISPTGEILFRAGADDEIVKVVEIDSSIADDKVVGNNDVFQDRRPELYQIQ
jgi:predicted amidohydrolase